MTTIKRDPLEEYLHEMLGLAPQLRAWPGTRTLPYALRDPFEFLTGVLMGRPLVLAIQRATPAKLTVGEIERQIRRIEAAAGQPVVYVTPHMPAFERARLVARKVPFIVPGAQMYLPDVGVDFRERVRAVRQTTVTRLAPSTQAMLIPHLLFDQWHDDWSVSQAAEEQHYTAMTASRVARELVAAGLFSEHVVNRQHYLRPLCEPRQTWEAARPLLRTPVLRRFWLTPDEATVIADGPLAGVSALAELTMLGAPEWPITAVDATTARAIRGHPVDRTAGGAPVSDGPVCEVWRYAPWRGPGTATVDPLSLILSLQTEEDARVQSALQDLTGHLPW